MKGQRDRLESPIPDLGREQVGDESLVKDARRGPPDYRMLVRPYLHQRRLQVGTDACDDTCLFGPRVCLGHHDAEGKRPDVSTTTART